MASLTITGSTIEPAAKGSGADGIALYGGSMTMTDTAIHDWPQSAIFTSPHFDLLRPGRVNVGSLSALDSAVSLLLDHVEITSCPLGIHYDAGSPDGQFRLHNSHVQTTHTAVSLVGGIAAADLGTAASPGNNQLETGNGTPALSDGRDTAGAAIDAHGTTLNGVSYSGDILGPADSPGYHIAGPNTIHF